MISDTTTILTIDDSLGTMIPKAMLERYRLAEGDRVRLVEMEDGILVTPIGSNTAKAMAAYERSAQKYRNAMRELAE